MKKNKNLHKAKNNKNDEFYTQISDIEKELKHYKDYFKNKIIFCNCDDPKESHFWKYFEINFNHLGLKKLISTHFGEKKPSYKLEKTNGDIIKTLLKQNGDFRSSECIEILKEADLVVTNPPFSLFREYVAQLNEYKKKFIIIGNKNAITYKEIFKLIKDNKLWLGYTSPQNFLQPDGTMGKLNGLTRWFINIKIKKRNEDLILYKKYNTKNYPKYDNYNAINVDKVKDIPVDYNGVIGVPITFMDKYSPKQFEILRCSAYSDTNNYGSGALYIKRKKKYARILIKNKKLNR